MSEPKKLRYPWLALNQGYSRNHITAILQFIHRNQATSGGCTMDDIVQGLGQDPSLESCGCIMRLTLDRMTRPCFGLLACDPSGDEQGIYGKGKPGTKYCLGYEKKLDEFMALRDELPMEERRSICQSAMFDSQTPEPFNANWEKEVQQ